MKIFETENLPKQTPIFLLYTKNVLIKDFLLNDLLKNGKVIITQEDTEDKQEKGLYKIPISSVTYINKIEEAINYAVIFIEDETDKKNFFNILAKLQADQCKTLIILPVRKFTEFQDLITDFTGKKNFDIGLLGDLLSRNQKTASSLNLLLNDLFKTKKIELTGDDLTAIFPISENDLKTAIYQVLFAKSKKNKIFSFFYNHPQTLISLVHVLKHIEADLEIKFSDNKDVKTNQINHSKIEEVLFKHSIELEYLDHLFAGFKKAAEDLSENFTKKIFQLNQEKDFTQQPAENYFLAKKTLRKKSGFLKTFLFSLGLAVITILIFNLLAFLSLFYLIKLELTLVKESNYLKLSQLLPKIIYLSNLLEPQIKTFGSLLPFEKDFYSLSDFNKQALPALNNVKTLIENQTFSRIKLVELISALNSTYFTLEKAGLETDFIKNNSLNISNYSKLLSLETSLQTVFNQKDKKNYLLLFENNGELRPTGGFIGSLGELSLENGKIGNLEIKDVYDLDGQLKAHIEPHYIIRRYLQPHLYLRDSNFDPDFEKSASMAALLYNLESGKMVDGIISFDYSVLKSILQVMGPINLRDYNKTIDANNAFEFIQNTIDTNFFPGSKQKKEVLNAILKEISLNLEKDKNNLFKLILLIPKLIQEKHILFAFSKNSIQSAFAANGFSDSFQDQREKNTDTFYDLLAINEANIGVNKANTYIKRSVKYDVFLDNAITSKVMIDLNNMGEKNLDYKAYIRVIVPSNSSLLGIKIDNQDQAVVPAITDSKIYENKNFKKPTGFEVDTIPVGNNAAFGFIVIAAKNRDTKIEISYKNNKETFATGINYSLLYFKQPGTEIYPFRLTVHYPETLSLQNFSNSGNGLAIIDRSIDKDNILNLNFTR